jgi:hypothetical protein
MEYPATFLRGITDPNYITPGGVSAAAFPFSVERTKGEWFAESINWEDNSCAIIELMSRLNKKGQIQFKAGIVRGPKECLEIIQNQEKNIRAILSYEREELSDNPFHGNLLLHKKTDKQQLKNIAGMLAAFCSDIRPAKTDEVV